jgi:hypothetical protein
LSHIAAAALQLGFEGLGEAVAEASAARKERRRARRVVANGLPPVEPKVRSA